MNDAAKEFRRVLGHYPTGVCAVTAMTAADEPVGLIVGSFTSVSLDPPLVGFFPDRSSSTWEKIRTTGRFCINVLGDCHHEICFKLSARSDRKFDGIAFKLSQLGSPIIDGALAWIDCTLDAVHEAGDHFIVLGLVRRLGLHDDGSPMIFHKGLYNRIGPNLTISG